MFVYTYFILPPLVFGLVLGIFWIFKNKKRQKDIILLSQLDNESIVNQQHDLSEKKEDITSLSFKLIQAGITLKEYNEARFLFAFMGLFVGIIIPFFVGKTIAILVIVLSIICIFFGGKFYLMIAKAERVEKIERDLGTFLDLVNVILEAGGSLKNAFLTVSIRGKKIIDDELLKEISILEYEMSNYTTKEAYTNLKERIDSPEMDKVVDFLILSEETGIGVKNIFTTQSAEMKQDKFYKIKGKVSTLNMYLMIVIFIFILPAVGAFVIFPMQAGVIATGF